MSRRFEGRTVVVTGVGRAGQVGDQLAHAFAREGAAVALLGRTMGEIEARAASIRVPGAEVIAIAADLTSDTAAGTAAREVAEFARSHGGVHALVHAAGGFAVTGKVTDTERGRWDDMIAISLTTAFVTARAMLPLLRETRGSCLFFASAAALPGAKVENVAAYAVAKSGVVTLMRAIALEEATAGVRANAVAPTAIRTPENEKAMGMNGRYVEPADLAAAVLFLCSDESRAITGQVIALG